MLQRLLGTKVGMTQLFDAERNVVPVTVINVADLIVLQIKTQENDGYTAVQLGRPRKRYLGEKFSAEWLKNKKEYFLHIREVHVDAGNMPAIEIGQKISFEHVGLKDNDRVSVTGVSRGLGFQGVVKRHGFAGGPKSHGSNFHRAPGSSGNMRRQGEVLKNKRFPGHMGAEQVTIHGLTLVHIDRERGQLFVKGSVPGKKDTLIFVAASQR